MSSISDTLARFRQFGGGLPGDGGGVGAGRLVPLAEVASNPGNLRGLIYVPADLPAGAPLVVVLHGCTQTAEGYDRGSGWSALADRFGFAVLYPEQQRANNPNLCFNWFAPADIRRGDGEVESIRAMTAAAVDQDRLDPARVFVTGLSAGGAMASAMLANHPEMFAGGAIVAGLPYGTASGVQEALERMRGQGHDRAALTGRLRDASAHRGRWPTVSVWHGTADATVSATNAEMIVDQWRGVHAVGAPQLVAEGGGWRHRTWRDAAGRVVLEDYLIAGMGHGTPIATVGDEAAGVAGAYMLDVGLSSTYRIAASWGIVPATAPTVRPADRGEPQSTPAAPPAFDPARVINDALRAAGLMKA
jgi:poly(hydroxyalkanoate) depolymerase family esterase